MELFRAFGRLVLEGQEAVMAGLAQAEQAGQSFSQSLEAVGGGLKATGDGMSKFVTGPIVGVSAALGGLAFSAASAGDEIAKSARAAGLSISTYQELEFALGRLAGITEGETNRALQALNRTIVEGLQGKENAVEQLRALGFSMEDIASGAITTEDAFNATVRAIEEAGTAAEAQAIAMEMLGRRGGLELAEAIRSGGESIADAREIFEREIGGITQEQADMAESFTDNWDVVRRQMGQFTRELGFALLPVLDDLISVSRDKLIPVLVTWAEWMVKIIEFVGSLDDRTQEWVTGLIVVAATLGPILSLLGRIIIPISKLVGWIAKLAASKTALSIAAGLISVPFLKFIAVAAAVTAAVTAAIAIFQNFGAILEWFGRRNEQVADLASRGWERLLDAYRWFGQQGSRIMEMSVDDIIGFFRDLPGRILGFIRSMVEGVIGRLTDMADRVRGILRRLARAIVGNSIIPDMASDVINEIGAMADSAISESARMAKGMTDQMPRELRAPGLGRDNGLAGDGSYIDLRHAIIHDDRDMLGRMRRQGVEPIGAF
jgi:hypothetical protein